MKNCSSCNKPILENAKFCPECGAAVGAATCPECQSPVKRGAKFCAKCGASLMGAGVVAGTATETSIESDLTESAEKAKPRSSWQATLLPLIIIPALVGIFFLLTYNKEKPKPSGVMGQEEQGSMPGTAGTMQGGGMEEVFARIDKMKAALQANPKDTTALFGLGQMYEMAAKFPEAEDYYRRYLEVSPGNAEVRMSLAGIYFNQQQLDKAEAEMREAVRRRPTSDFAHYNLGVIYAASQKKDEAIKAWHKVMELSPGSELAQKSATNIQAMNQ